MPTPTIALTMIVGGSDFADGNPGPQRLRACIQSVRDHVDQVIIVDTGTNGSAQEIGEELDCEVYPFDWVDDFSAARNVSLSKVTTDWFLWLDHDDIAEGADALQKIVSETPEDIGGVWCKYLYGFDEYGNCTTLHSRERILRTSVGWTWHDPVHETLVPDHAVGWVRCEDFRVMHTGGHEGKAARNLPILHKQLCEEPEDIRVLMHLGNQYFAQQEWAEAVRWYRSFFTNPMATPLDKWQCMTYSARACRELGDFKAALEADKAALFEIPAWADSWLGLAETYLKLEDYRSAIVFAEIACYRDVPDTMTFVNMLDYHFRPYNILNVCYGMIGEYDKAIWACDEALKVRENQEEVIGNKLLWEHRQRTQKIVEGILTVAPSMDDQAFNDMLMLQPDMVLQEEPIRDIMVPMMLRASERGTQPKMVMFCGDSAKDWSGNDLSEGTVYGSELCATEIAQRFADDGWNVTVYNRPGPDEGPQNGVFYSKWTRFRPEVIKPDLFVAWRSPEIGLQEYPHAKRRWLWLHDVNYPGRMTETAAQGFDKIFGISQWHADYLQMAYPFLQGKVGYLYNGVDLSMFEEKQDRVRYRCIYASSPDRGLLNLLHMWPQIRSIEPTAELHVFYGWSGIDFWINQGRRDLMEFKRVVSSYLDQPGIQWRGKMPQRELAKEMCKSDLLLYPTSFLETFGLVPLEAMAAGMLPVTSKLGAITEVVGDAGFLVPGSAESTEYQRKWLGVAFASLVDKLTRAEFMGSEGYNVRGKERAKLFTWEATYGKWKAEVEIESPVVG